tara:strand:+ start:321 stop:644 length:324 start_codon:yes stop_codon:yes gene_type:complete
MTDKVFDNYTIPNYKTFYLIVEIIDILLEENQLHFDNWKATWDDHIGDLSAPDYASIMSERSTLLLLRKIILNGDIREYDSGKDSKGRDFRSRDLFKMAMDIVEGRN